MAEQQTFKIELEVDRLDFDAIQNACGRRQAFRMMPDDGGPVGNIIGRTLAEICRGWMEFCEFDKL